MSHRKITHAHTWTSTYIMTKARAYASKNLGLVLGLKSF